MLPHAFVAGADGRLFGRNPLRFPPNSRPWRALTGGYSVETVEDCVTETQTGFQQRRPQQLIDVVELRKSLSVVHFIGDRQRAELELRVLDIALDRGEASL